MCRMFYLLLLLVALTGSSIANNVEQHFKEHEVVPDLIPHAPKQQLHISYGDGHSAASYGNILTPTQVKAKPHVEWKSESHSYYTLILTDPDAPSRAEPKHREFKHWLVVNIPGHNIAHGETLAAYVGSGPPKGSGLHRYVFLVYKQPSKLSFDEAHVPNNSRQDRAKFNTSAFAKKYDLGQPIAGNFYQAEWDEYVPTVHKQLAGT